jgi:hypothetical protein
MSVVKEYRCDFHGEFDSTTGRCPSGCKKEFIHREFRTPPNYRRPGKMAWTDRQMREIAAENGLTDMRSDGKAGVSVLADAQRRKQLAAEAKAKKEGGRQLTPHWVEVPHAKPGFGRIPGAEVPKVDGSMFGVKHANHVAWDKIPPPRPHFVKRDPGGY